MSRLLYIFLKVFAKFTSHVLYHVEVQGLENIPNQGKVILASSHGSFLDPIILLHVITRKYHPIAGSWLFKIWWLSWVFKVTNCIPTGGSSGRAIDTLNKDKMVLVFPEGRCRHEREICSSPIPKKGVAVFALKTGAPVVPIGVKGSFEAWPNSELFPRLFKKIEVRIGQPLQLERRDEEIIPIEVLEKNVEIVMSAIRKLLI